MTARIVGLDIGSASVRAVEVKNPDKPSRTILKVQELPLPDGSVSRGEVLDVSTVSMTLRRLWAMGGFGSKDVVLGMGGPRVLSRELTMPRAPINQLRESLQFHVQDLLPVPVAEAILDFYPISEDEGEAGPVVNGLLVAAVKDAVNANIAAVNKAGLRAAHVDLIPFALARALAPVSSSRGLEAIVSIGGNSTNVIITQDGVPHFVRIIPSGGDDITRALSTRLKVPLQQAELIKRAVGLEASTATAEQRPAVEIIYEIAGEQLTSIRNTLAFYLNSRPATALSRILLTGGGGEMSGIVRAMTEITGVAVVQSDPLGGVPVDKRVRASREQLTALTTAVGLTLGVSE
ncbi:MAG: type IV pilus assembly protein PilM [Rhodoglobus sp.]